MKRLLTSIVLVVWTITILAQSIPQETVGGKIGETIQKEDSIKEVKWQARRDSIKHVNDSLRQLQVLDINRYKLYPTQNKWTFLELDTQTGRIWQVQQWSTENARGCWEIL